ncbi:MAG: phosphonoacetaldehyde hydrolase [Gammaproteobacteria bacterium]|nr:phosphonoacetaldehyde hydrolase [Gammaproteobacteria bacterium]
MFRLISRAITTAAKSNPVLRLPAAQRLASPQLKKILTTNETIKAAVLDFSGTTTDKYVIAPAVAFVEAFKASNIDITMDEARAPMGLHKKKHIEAILQMESVKQKWKNYYGRNPNTKDLELLFENFVPIQLYCIKNYGELLPHTADVVQSLRRDGIKIGATTGFIRSMADILIAEAAKQGCKFDVTVTGDEVINGTRPQPFMLYRNMDLLGVSNPRLVVKVDDTVSGVGEGLHAGCWSVGVSDYSNYVGINSLEEAASIDKATLEKKRQHSAAILKNSGAHYVIPSIADLPGVIADINHRLRLGELPNAIPEVPRPMDECTLNLS